LTKIQAEYPEIIAIQNDSNEGFGRANNLGAKYAQGNYLLFLNSDMVLRKDTIEVCYNELLSIPKAGVLSCPLFNEDGSKQRSLFYSSGTYKGILEENLVLDKLCTFKKGDIHAVIGAFMMIPTRIFKTVGGFDRDFFMYSEELELCDRIRLLGYKIAQTTKTNAIHKHGGSTSDSGWSQRQKLASSQLYYRKKNGVLGLFFFHILKIFNFITNLLFMWFLDTQYRKNLLSSFKYYIQSLKHTWAIVFLRFRKNQGFLKIK
jgi:GT2 family glycosyltransferase